MGQGGGKGFRCPWSLQGGSSRPPLQAVSSRSLRARPGRRPPESTGRRPGLELSIGVSIGTKLVYKGQIHGEECWGQNTHRKEGKRCSNAPRFALILTRIPGHTHTHPPSTIFPKSCIRPRIRGISETLTVQRRSLLSSYIEIM